jgi:hypothetical protein
MKRRATNSKQKQNFFQHCLKGWTGVVDVHLTTRLGFDGSLKASVKSYNRSPFDHSGLLEARSPKEHLFHSA